MGGLYLEIEVQSLLLDNVDRGLIAKLVCWTKQIIRKKKQTFFARSDGTKISSPKYQNIFFYIFVQHRLAISNGLIAMLVDNKNAAMYT